MRLKNQNDRVSSVGSTLVFCSKALAFQIKRACRETIRSEAQRHLPNDSLTGKAILADSRTPLWTAHESSERVLMLGKIQNLRLAIRRLNGVEVPSGCVFSFWKQLGRTSRLKGYVPGRELREGCLIPTIGGGLCQLSNALYDAALKAGFEIVERHPHTQVIPGSLAEVRRDATVFWNYVDLRFRHAKPFRIEAELTTDSLLVRFRGEAIPARRQFFLARGSSGEAVKPAAVNCCLSCVSSNCFRHDDKKSAGNHGQTAYLLDEYWPEFDRFVSTTKSDVDSLLIPLDGRRLGRSNYAWTTAGFAAVKQQWILTLKRSLALRKLKSQGALRQEVTLAFDERLAELYASQLSYNVSHLVVAQRLLPYLWRRGDLGGRTFDVLMTRLPLAVLQDRLDAAFRLHPESGTLADFRADAWLANAESEALQQARRIITPHTDIAALYPQNSQLLQWSLPPTRFQAKPNASRMKTIVFPAATLGRKGVYELREALVGLDIELTLLGPVLEAPGFWDGLRVKQLAAGADWLGSAAVVVLPSFIEHNPRRILEAVAHGVPAIASAACGLQSVKGVTNVQLDSGALRAEIQKVLSENNRLAISNP